jgi:hypothetical protein
MYMSNKFDEIVEGKHGEEKEDKKGKEKRANHHNDVKEITIRFRPILIERIAYALVIIILLFFVFRSQFCNKAECLELTELNDTEVVAETANAPETVQKTETPQETVTDLSENASISVKASDIIIENGTGTGYKVSKINFKIINSGDILRGTIAIYWYDPEDSDVIKSKVRASTAVIVPAGDTMSFSATQFSGSYLNSINPEETFVFVLSDIEGNVLDRKEIEIKR